MKRKYKIVIAFLITAMVLSIIPVFSALAETSYEELWQQKIQYEKSMEMYSDGTCEHRWAIYYECSWRFIPFTDAGKKLTYEIKTEEHFGEYLPGDMFLIGIDRVLYSPELYDIYYDSLKDSKNDEPGVCRTRKMVQELGITEAEMRNAFEKIKNEPESAREVFSFLSDKEFEEYLFSLEIHLDYMKPMPDFAISALFLDNDTEAQYLLSQKSAVYVPELGYALYKDALMYDMKVEEIAQFDLTTSGFGYYLANLRKSEEFNLNNGYGDFVYKDGRTALEKVEYLESAREKQLSEKAGREAAFVAELGSMVTADRLFGTAETAPTVTVAELAVCDLTGEDMGNFLVYLRENIESYESTADPADGRTPLEKLEYLEAQREAQLRAAEMGDGMEKAFLAVGIGIGALVLLAIVRKKRKI